MASKTLLVAQREFVENLRTKTFWIGILAFPILIAISIGAGYVLARLKQTQDYAVLDLSEGQIGPQIERQARSGDMDALARVLAKGEGLANVLAPLRQELGDDLARLAAASRSGDGEARHEPEVPAALRDRLYEWFQRLPASDAEALGRQQKALQTASKYRLRPLAAIGVTGDADAREQQLVELVKKGDLFAYFVIGKKPEVALDDFRYFSKNVTDSDLRNWYERAATKVVQDLRIAAASIPRQVAQQIRAEVDFREQKLDAHGGKQDVTVADKAGGWAPMAFVYLLWVAVFTAAQMLLTNTVEEKSNRIIEVLLSSVSPGQLMSGKIWGIGATGLTLTVSWVLCGLGGLLAAESLMPGVNLDWAAAARDPLYLGSFIAYFLLGYLLYAAILVGLGSVTNSLKEAQNLLQPVFILLIVPLVSMVFVVQEPNGTVAKVLSYIPLFTPFTMMNRAGGPPELYEYAITSVLLIASVWLAFRAAGRIFRVGVLMTGNPPKLREILGWLRAK